MVNDSAELAAAIEAGETDIILNPGTYVVNFEGNNVVDSDFNGLWQVKAGAENVTVNGLN